MFAVVEYVSFKQICRLNLTKLENVINAATSVVRAKTTARSQSLSIRSRARTVQILWSHGVQSRAWGILGGAESLSITDSDEMYQTPHICLVKEPLGIVQRLKI